MFRAREGVKQRNRINKPEKADIPFYGAVAVSYTHLTLPTILLV